MAFRFLAATSRSLGFKRHEEMTRTVSITTLVQGDGGLRSSHRHRSRWWLGPTDGYEG